MPDVAAPLYSLNGGEVGDEALARLDLQRMQFAGSLYENMLPRVIGSMTLRPGLEHVTDINWGDVRLLEYSYSGTSTFVPVLSNQALRIIRDGAVLSRASVSTVVTNGLFDSFSGWVDDSVSGASAGVSGSNLVLTGAERATAAATQTLSIAAQDQNVEHALRLDVVNGPVSVYIGTASGGYDLLEEVGLDDGVHSLTFTPTGASAYLRIFHNEPRVLSVASCTIEAAGDVVIAAPWTSADLANDIIRYKQNLDVIYLASGVYQQREIQRRSDTSWGLQRYKVDNGPFTLSQGNISLTPSGYTGSITLSAGAPYFNTSMAGRLIRLVQSGQTVIRSFTGSAADQADYVRVSGVGASRSISISITGSWSGQVVLQEASDDGTGNPGAWVNNFGFTSSTVNSNFRFDDDDNVIKYVRFVVEAGGLTSGTAVTTLSYTGGSRSGVARITSVSSGTAANAEVLSRFYSLNPTYDWDYSTWSDYDGWPSSVETFSGRLFWARGGSAYGSVPDAYKNYNDDIEGDSAPIIRSINPQSQRGALWMLGLQRLVVGTDNSEISIKASGFDDPLTATAWFPVDASTRGSANIRAVKSDTDGIFVQSSGTALFRLALRDGGFDYASSDLTAMHEEICDGSQIVDIAVQRRPDTIIWLILASGEARALTYEPEENVIAWSRVKTDGLFKRVCAARGSTQDSVYFAVVRNGTQRLEKLANLSDCRGAALNCIADAFSRFTATAGQTVFPVPQLDGQNVVVWANGAALHDQDNFYTVASGQVVLPAQAEGANIVIGLPYTGRWRSTKLAYGAAKGTALMRRKRVSKLGLYLRKTGLDGVRAGKDFGTLRKFTAQLSGKPVPAGAIQDTFDADLMPISSDWSTDSRVCIEAKAPYPFTAAAMVLDLETNG